jgi:hypothetical protein
MQRLFTFLLLFAMTGATAQTGIVWSAAQPVADNSFDNDYPRLAVDGAGEPLVVWGKLNTKQAMFARRSGTGFTTPIALNPAAIPVFTSAWAGPTLAAHGDTVYAVFKETPEHENYSYLTYSYDGGATFALPTRLDDLTTGLSRFPTVSTDDDGQPVVAFMKFDDNFLDARYVSVRSYDYGQSFTPEVLASGFSGGEVCDCCPAAVAVAGERVAVLYRDNLNNIRNTWSGLSTDGGLTFDEGVAVDEAEWFINQCPSSGPDAVIIGDTLYAVFMNGGGGTVRSYLSRTSLNTLQTAGNEPFSGSGIQNFPRIASYGNAVAIVLRQVDGPLRQIRLFFTPDITSGAPFAEEIVASGVVEQADVAVTATNVHVVWQDTDSGTVRFQTGTYDAASNIAMPVETPLQVFPNPLTAASAHVTLRVAPGKTIRCTLTDLTGRIVVQTTLPSDNNGDLWLKLPSVMPGTYLLRAVSDAQTWVTKLERI